MTHPYQQSQYQPEQQSYQPYQPYLPQYAASPAKPPRKKRRIFLWVFMAVQVIFIVWLIDGAATIHTQTTAGDIGKGVGAALVVMIWVVVDFLLGTTYGIYRLASRR
jgi:hypothetical protein